MKKILVVFGTRPEAIKMAPVVKALQKINNKFNCKICITGQHQEMLNPVLKLFNIKPDFNLNLMQTNQTLTDLTKNLLSNLEKIYLSWKPDLVLVHGDTTTAFSACLAAFYQKITVGHVEAGLRTNNIYSPWPEEMNRKFIDSIARFNFAPTKIAKENLLKENIPKQKIYITGNTVIDALQEVSKKIDQDVLLRNKLSSKYKFIDKNKKLILVTGHRRENFGLGLNSICEALVKISKIRNDVQIVYPVHLNPNVQKPVRKILSGLKNIYLIEPQEYLSFVYLMKKSFLILTDSGGVQEEAPMLKKPVLVMRQVSERVETLKKGNSILIGVNPKKIFRDTINIIENSNKYRSMINTPYLYGKGLSSTVIAKILEKNLKDF
jgi:UDP-N-acetylglucosamine 2-epimerase (non-hydrolysing)